MSSIRQRVEVRFTYDVHFTEHVFNPENPLLAGVLRGAAGPDAPDRPRRMLVVVDDGVWTRHLSLGREVAAYAAAHAGAVRLAADPVVVPGGEQAKNDPALVERLHAAIREHGICRHSVVVGVGGGAVLDLVGYAAATAHRGVRLVRVPTTVLAQNDAAVGVKNGVNAFGTKNFVGTFAPPFAVINDARFLWTLDDRDWRAGISEAVKVALLRDAAFFEAIEADAARLCRRDRRPMERLIRRCAELHLEHIATSGDPFEFGSSRPLDFGHWAAHRLEQLTGHRLRHGEAVAVGLALDCTYSCLDGALSAAALGRILGTLERAGLPTYVPELRGGPGGEGLFRGLEEFREHLGGRLTIMLLDAIGQGREVHAVDRDVYTRAVDLLHARSRRSEQRRARRPAEGHAA